MKYFIVGGAGFIGSHLTKKILETESNSTVVVFDNFSSGKRWHLESVKEFDNLKIIEGDVKDLDRLKHSMTGIDIVYHFASNPDIAKAISQPDIDFWEGTYLTNNILEAMRINNVTKLIYASGSGVYGDTGLLEASEDYSPLLPISTYGASKLACEALISSYCYMFEMNASAFRFANVVGPHQTHGVGYDFIKKLLENPVELLIFGDGTQSKSYIYVSDIINAIRLVEKKCIKGFSYFNVATLDYISVTEIAEIVKEILRIENVKYCYTGGDRGWKGDVPIIRMNSEKIRNLGWLNQHTTIDAIKLSVRSLYEDAKLNKFNWNK
jgi:UDP-glucose 4-epimerase